MRPEARLGDAPHLQALYEPSPRLDVRPRPILQRSHVPDWPARARRLGLLGAGALLVNGAFGIGLFLLLSFRDSETPREVEIPVEVVVEPAKPSPKASGTGEARADGTGSGGPTGPAGPSQAVQTAAASPDPQPPTQMRAESAPQPPASPAPPAPKLPQAPDPAQDPKPPQAPKAGPPSPPPRAASNGPKLVAAPQDASRAATQARDNKPANLQPDEHQTDAATREAKPVATPQTLTTPDPKAGFAVPAPVEAKPTPVDKPTPPTLAKTPSATDMLAAALPMDTSAMPSSFRAVLAGNSTAQVKAAYAGVVQGRLSQAQPQIVETAYSQRLKGNVSVVFTLDDAGNLASLSIVQSSGDPKLDALALHWIQVAAPFPAPPPDAERTFKKALLFGN